jgi:D-alanyl-D-alanine carboxypeptidase/D-alanyl-D-alanine-endopeptidase (penicillin-binding protein 4)
MSARAYAFAFALGFIMALPLAARAVDRTLGAQVPKPGASGAPWTPRERARLRTDVDALLDAAPTLQGAHVGLIALDARSGEVLYERRADDLFQPASTLKMLTGSVALASLGPDYRFRTTVERVRGAAPGGGGDALVVHGGNDPTFAASDLDDAAAAIARTGAGPRDALVLDLRRADARERRGAGWSWDDFPYGFAAVVNALPLEENVVHVDVTAGANAGDPATIALRPVFAPVPAQACVPLPTARLFTNHTTTLAANLDDSLDAAYGPCGDVVVSGGVPLGKTVTVDVAVDAPEAIFDGALRAALSRRGVTLRAHTAYATGPLSLPEPGGQVVWEHQSEPLRDLLGDCWIPSDNLAAELLLRELDVVQNARSGTADGGAAIERAWLAAIHLDVGGLTVVDGSGLSSYDRLTPRTLAGILKIDWDGPYRDLVLDDLPIAGVRGTLAYGFAGTPAAMRIFAKTGSMSHVRALAGYLATRRHGAVTFAWLVDDWSGVDDDWHNLLARVLGRFIED